MSATTTLVATADSASGDTVEITLTMVARAGGGGPAGAGMAAMGVAW